MNQADRNKAIHAMSSKGIRAISVIVAAWRKGTVSPLQTIKLKVK